MRCLSHPIKTWLDGYNHTIQELLAGGFKQTTANTRTGLAELTRSLVTQSPSIPWIRDDRIKTAHHSIPIRIYHPRPNAALPVLFYVHGGGHMAGSVEVYDPICRKLAETADYIVVSVDYRLAPEDPYPAGVEDAYTAAGAVPEVLHRHNLKFEDRLSIAGDSAGGAICATLSHRAQFDPNLNIRHQVLIYPSLDYSLSLPSITVNGSGYLLESSKIQWYFDHYFQHNEDRRAASPLFMDFTRQLPATLVITAEFCPLRDEGIAYLDTIRSKGITSRHLHFDDMIHAFINMEDIAASACKTLYHTVSDFLNNS